jgi:hypothetical protein
MAAAIATFSAAASAGTIAASRAIPTLSWDESAAVLGRYALGSDWPLCWTPAASASKCCASVTLR